MCAGRVVVSTPEHSRYRKDPAFLEERYGASPLATIVQRAGVVGAARLVVKPSFDPEHIYTLVYVDDVVEVEERVGAVNLWMSLFEDTDRPWQPPSVRVVRVRRDALALPFADFEALKRAAIGAPSVEKTVLGGQSYMTLDGTSHRHQVCDRELDFKAIWCQLCQGADNQQAQSELLDAYYRLLDLVDELSGEACPTSSAST